MCVVYATFAAPADAIVESVGGTTVGLQPRVLGTLQAGPSIFTVGEGTVFDPLPETFENATANPVLHGSNVYLDYWDPTNHYHNDWKQLIDKFVEDVNKEENSANVFSVDEQYTDITERTGVQPCRLPRLLPPTRRRIRRPGARTRTLSKKQNDSTSKRSPA